MKAAYHLPGTLLRQFPIGAILFTALAAATPAAGQLILTWDHSWDHADDVNGVAFSPDGRFVASASDDNTVRVWDVNTKDEWFRYRHANEATSVAFSPDGMLLASGAQNTVWLLDMASRQLLPPLQLRSNFISSVAFSPDGALLAAGASFGSRIIIWDVATRQELVLPTPHRVNTLAFSADGTLLAAGGWRSTVWLWDVATLEPAPGLEGHGTRIESLAFSPTKPLLAVGSWNRPIQLWDVSGRRVVAEIPAEYVNALAFSPDGRLLAGEADSGTGPPDIGIWDAASGRQVYTLRGHTGFGNQTESIAFSPDGKLLVSGSQDNTVKLWPIEPVVRMTVSDVAVEENDGEAVFTVQLDAASIDTVTVWYETLDGTATAGQDYAPLSGRLAFTPGQLSHLVRVPVIDDLLFEPDETFTLVLSNPEGAELRDDLGEATIRDNDVYRIAIADVVVGESDGPARFVVTVNPPNPEQEVTIRYATLDGTATGGADYTAVSGEFSVPPGQASATISVPILDDNVEENDETFVVRLSGPQHAVIGDGEGQGTITDDDGALTVSIFDGQGVEDAGLLHLPVRLSEASPGVVRVLFGTSDATAESGLDYSASQGFIVFEPGSTEGVVTVAMFDDQLPEAEESFNVTLRQPLNVEIARGTAAGIIVDNDGMPLFRVGDVTVGEGEAYAVFLVTLSSPSTQVATAAYRTINGTAEAGEDYVAAAGTLEFAPGEKQKEVHVKLLRRERDWRAETFLLALGSTTGAGLEDIVATATIVEDDPVEHGVRAAYLSRLLRTSASHVVEAIGERFRWQRMDAACAPVGRESLQVLRHVNPAWDPSAGELLSGCALTAARGAFGMWGRGAFTRLSGREGPMSLNADITTATLGADYGFPSGIQAGVLLAYSQSVGKYVAPAANGEMGSRLTAVYPYASYGLASSRLWALAGAGRGLIEVDGAEVLETDIASSLVAAGAAGWLATGRIAQLGYQGDIFLARAEAENAVQASRIRAGLEGSAVLGRSLRPYLVAALRYDGGDAETGMGLEAGGGVRLQQPGGRLRAELSSRGLLTHANSDITEWGVAAALHYGAPQGLGPTAEIRPVWGPAHSGGLQALWRHDAVADRVVTMPGQKRVEMRLGYGTRLERDAGLARPVLAVTLRESGRDFRLGYEVYTESGFTASAAATAWESSPWRPVSYGLTARAALRW